MESSWPLQRKWALWEMWNQNQPSSTENFEQTMQKVGEFGDLHSFWQHWNSLPHSDPSGLFYNQRTKTTVFVVDLKTCVEALAVFENSSKPSWEDPTNCLGSDINYRASLRIDQLKPVWDKLVFSVIGETLPSSEDIVGCRIVDKKKSYKLELWLKFDANNELFSKKTSEIKQALKTLFPEFNGMEPRINSHKPL